jgi:hypothetical protein
MFAVSQVSITTTATQIVADNYGAEQVTIQNLGPTAVYIGGPGVTTSNGFPIQGAAGTSLTLPATTAIYGIVAAGTQTVAVLETA